MATSIKFYGLVGIGRISSVFQASMPTVGGHKAALAVRIDKLAIDVSTAPDRIFHAQDGVQYGSWALGTNTLTFTGGTGAPTWSGSEQDQTINLAKHEPRKPIRAPRNGGASIVLPEGQLTAGREPLDRIFFKVTRDSLPNPIEIREFSVAIIWTGLFRKLTGGGLNITLKDGAVATVTNVAPVQQGHTHFHHYYDEFFVTVPNPTDQIKITNQNVEVFDCVPPVPLPEP